MAYLLHIESSSTVCSVALSNDSNLLALEEIDGGYTHAENLHVFIQKILKDKSISAKELSAVSVSIGPGSYTGLRIGFSAAKGLAYALNIPLISIDTLQALAFSALEKEKHDGLYCPMIDARRMEVYTAVYNQQLEMINPAKALILDEQSILSFPKEKDIYFFGDGMPKAKELLQTLPNARFIESIVPSAKALINLAFQKYTSKEFADIAYSEPFYLKEVYFTTSKKIN